MTAPTQTTAAAKQLSDGNTQGMMVCPALDSSGAPYKLGFFGVGPIALPTPAGYTTMQTAGSTTSLFINSATTGGVGSTQFTFGDVVAALKGLGLLKA
jgi:hypothetical protein